MVSPVSLNNLSTAHLRRASAACLQQTPTTPNTTDSTEQDYTKIDFKTPNLSIVDSKLAINEKIKTLNEGNRFEIIAELTEVLDLYLQDIWKDYAQPEKRDATLEGLNNILGNRGQGNIVMAQINPTPGDLEGNSKKVMSYIKAAEAIGIDTIIFPELSLMG
ncbi:MAG: hypothetical protein HYZ79_09750, partial [Candidatus Melainabacteria bacterium]|nr:hypothetical protein [Candidatus Melainabacteria bacterium]